MAKRRKQSGTTEYAGRASSDDATPPTEDAGRETSGDATPAKRSAGFDRIKDIVQLVVLVLGAGIGGWEYLAYKTVAYSYDFADVRPTVTAFVEFTPLADSNDGVLTIRTEIRGSSKTAADVVGRWANLARLDVGSTPHLKSDVAEIGYLDTYLMPRSSSRCRMHYLENAPDEVVKAMDGTYCAMIWYGIEQQKGSPGVTVTERYAKAPGVGVDKFDMQANRRVPGESTTHVFDYFRLPVPKTRTLYFFNSGVLLDAKGEGKNIKTEVGGILVVDPRGSARVLSATPR